NNPFYATVLQRLGNTFSCGRGGKNRGSCRRSPNAAQPGCEGDVTSIIPANTHDANAEEILQSSTTTTNADPNERTKRAYTSLQLRTRTRQIMSILKNDVLRGQMFPLFSGMVVTYWLGQAGCITTGAFAHGMLKLTVYLPVIFAIWVARASLRWQEPRHLLLEEQLTSLEKKVEKLKILRYSIKQWRDYSRELSLVLLSSSCTGCTDGGDGRIGCSTGLDGEMNYAMNTGTSQEEAAEDDHHHSHSQSQSQQMTLQRENTNLSRFDQLVRAKSATSLKTVRLERKSSFHFFKRSGTSGAGAFNNKAGLFGGPSSHTDEVEAIKDCHRSDLLKVRRQMFTATNSQRTS
ncbi:unnamed protein product, partial [Amoebophrya sp. A120]